MSVSHATAAEAAAPVTLDAMTTHDIAKGWEAAKADEAAAEKVKKAAAQVRSAFAAEARTRLAPGAVLTLDGNRRTQFKVSEYQTEKAGQILKALLPHLTPAQRDLLATIRQAPENVTDVCKLSFAPFKD